MSLKWDLSAIKDKDLCWRSGCMVPTCETLIFATMILGISKITEKNVLKFATRMAIWERCFSTFRPYPFRIAELRQYVGLSTNAEQLTDGQFYKKVRENLISDLEDEEAYCIGTGTEMDFPHCH